MTSDYQTFKRNIRLLRVYKSVPASTMSRDLGMQPKRVTQLEVNQGSVPTAMELMKVAEYFGVTPIELMQGEPVITFNISNQITN